MSAPEGIATIAEKPEVVMSFSLMDAGSVGPGGGYGAIPQTQEASARRIIEHIWSKTIQNIPRLVGKMFSSGVGFFVHVTMWFVFPRQWKMDIGENTG